MMKTLDHNIQIQTGMKTYFQVMIIVGWVFALMLTTSGCGRSGNGSAHPEKMETEVLMARDMAGDMASAPVSRQLATGRGESVLPDRPVDKQRIIRDGRMGIRVSDLETAKLRVDSLVSAFGAYFASERYYDTDRESAFHLSIRVPAAGFEALAEALGSGRGQVLYREVDARDVTEQFIDLESRLDSRRMYLERYRELLVRARNVQEILEIEDKIRVLEEEINSTTGRLQYLQDRVDYSTLELMLTREKEFRFEPGDRDRFAERLKQALHGGWTGTVDAVLFLFRLWPLWLLGAIAAVFLRRRYR